MLASECNFTNVFSVCVFIIGQHWMVVWLQYPEHCGKFVVISVRDLTTGYDSAQPDGKAVSSVLNQLL